MEEKARQIAIKYVYGNHDALTDEQEVKDMTKDIIDLVKEIQAKNNELLHDVINCDCETDNYTKHESTNGIIIYKCKDCGGCL